MEFSILQLAVSFYAEEPDFLECMSDLYVQLQEETMPEELEEFIISDSEQLYDLVTHLDMNEFIFLAQQVRYNYLLQQVNLDLKHKIKSFSGLFKLIWEDNKTISFLLSHSKKFKALDTMACSALAMHYAESVIDKLLESNLDDMHDNMDFHLDVVKYEELITVMEQFISKQENKKDYIHILEYIKNIFKPDSSIIDINSQGGFDAGTTG
jgi:hypothetical protein